MIAAQLHMVVLKDATPCSSDESVFMCRVRAGADFTITFHGYDHGPCDYATLKMRAGFGWPLSSTGPKSSTPGIAASRLRRTASEIKS
jgi:hypothetical protein